MRSRCCTTSRRKTLQEGTSCPLLRLIVLITTLGHIREMAAVSVSQATGDGLALRVITDADHEVWLVLYDPVKTFRALRDAAVLGASNTRNLAISVAYAGAIVGFVNLLEPEDPCQGAMEVMFSAAEKGFGPLMYDIAMSSSPNGIVSNRTSVSPRARNVWKSYLERRPDVDALPLDNVDDPKTPPPEDDCKTFGVYGDGHPLDFAYVTKTGVDVKSLVRADERFRREKLASTSRDLFDNVIVVAADLFFGKKYGSAT